MQQQRVAYFYLNRQKDSKNNWRYYEVTETGEEINPLQATFGELYLLKTAVTNPPPTHFMMQIQFFGP